MMNDWEVRPSTAYCDELLALVGGNSIVAQLLAQRGYDSPEKALPFLHPEEYKPSPPESLYGLSNAADLLFEILESDRNILVWGDFDVDGQTSTALLVSALQRIAGPERVRYHVPNRFKEGHGIRLEKLREWLSVTEFRPHCLLTCDTGISDGSAIGYAKDSGLSVIITDHHDPPSELVAVARSGRAVWGGDRIAVGKASLRRADAIVDPKFLTPQHPLASLPGVGVAYKLMEYVYALAGRAGEERVLLDLVALGIVADVAEQVQDTRYLLQLGLDQLRHTRRTGLLALMITAGLSPDSVDSEAIGFQLGPRLNALGRLEDASDAVELLTTSDPVRAGQLAAKMERLNQQRRLLTSQITAAALNMLEHRPEYLDRNAIVLAHENWHPGIVGIVASRLAEEFRKPTVLLVAPKDAPARGSARSTPGIDIGSAIAACSHLLLQFGGHPGAAGVTLPRDNIDRFREELHVQVAEHELAGLPQGLTVDAELALNEIDMDLVEQMNRLAPFGNGNPRPVFCAREVRLVEDRRIGKQAEHRKLEVTDPSETICPVIWFNGADNLLPPEPLDLAFTVSVNDYAGRRSVQLNYVDSRRSSEPIAKAARDKGHELRLVDLRQQAVAASELPQPPEAVWYAEGMGVPDPSGKPPYSPRHGITKGAPAALVVWSTPPAPDLLERMLDAVDPKMVVICGRNTTDDSLQHTVRQVAGMCKYALDRDGIVQLDRMAARLGSTEGVIRLSLLWLDARGTISLREWREGNSIRMESGNRIVRTEDADLIEAQLQEELAEVRAYRRFFTRAKLEALGLPAEASTARDVPEHS